MRSPGARHGDGRAGSTWQLDKAALWTWVQRRGFVLIALGVTATMAYLMLIVMPRVAQGLDGSAVIPGWKLFNRGVLYVHIFTAIPPLVLGLVAFSTRARRASLRVHRWIGTIYCAGIWISAVTGFALALANSHGFIAKGGFGLLAIMWFTTTLQAYRTARAKDLVAHRVWMIRSFALTLAVVTVRPMFLLGPPAGMTADAWYQLVTWICWTPNLLAAELYARATHTNGRLKSWRPRRVSESGQAARLAARG